MEPTYYTPTIEEFHVGFEFSYPIGYGKYEQQVVTTDKLEWLLKSNSIEHMRVKHLDRADIEGEGWKEREPNQFEFSDTHYMDALGNNKFEISS